MKIPFDIKYKPQIESGEYKVETRDGRKARIIHWDLNCTSPIVAVMDAHIDLPGEIVDVFSVSGMAFDDLESPSDLFIITPEPELSEFEHAFGLAIVDAPEPEEKEEWYPYIKEKAAELLDLARKELEPEVLERLEIAYKNQDEVVYENGKREGKAEALKEIEQDPESSYAFKRGFEYGKEEALKDLPKWEKCNKNTIYNTKFNLVENGVGRFLMIEGYQINIDSLEKLPGFKEDESHE